MELVLVLNIIGLILLAFLSTMLIILYFREFKDFKKRETELQKRIEYYIGELKKRSKDNDVDMY